MRRRTPAPLSAEQMIRDYLVRVSAAAQKVLPKGDRLLFVGRTRATIEARVGPIASADADDVAEVLTALGDPEVLARQERERLYSARRRGAAAQPAKLWKPDKPSKPARAARRDTTPLPRMRRTRGSGSRLIRRYGPWAGEQEDEAAAGTAGSRPAAGGPAAGTPLAAGGQDASGPDTGGQHAGQDTGGPGTGGQAADGAFEERAVPEARQPAPAPSQPAQPAQPKPTWPVIGPGTGPPPGGSRPAGGNGLVDTGAAPGGKRGQAGPRNGAGPGRAGTSERAGMGGPGPAGPGNGAGPGRAGTSERAGAGGAGPAGPGNGAGPAETGTPGRAGATAEVSDDPAGADDAGPPSIVPGMELAGEDEPLGPSKLGRPEPLTEAWAFVRKQPLESVSLLLIGVGGLILPFPVWLIGAVVSIWSRSWDRRDKWLAFTGPVLFTVVALIVMGITGQGNFFTAFGHATHHFGLLLRVGCLLCAGYLVWRLRRGPRRRRVPPWLRMR